MSLPNRFTKLKMMVGGNREKRGFEYNYGPPVEERMNITPVNRWHRRILSELEFAIRLSSRRQGQWDAQISQALDLLQQCMDRDGTLTKEKCLEAEALLMPLSQAAKEYELLLIAHAHIDMNWTWGWQETVGIVLSTFRTMLHLMDEYPQFCFSQSQASVYQIVEEYDPPLMQKIKERIAQGRWEITATAWVETDKNMPSTESLVNQIHYTRKYMQEHWGIDPRSLEIDFSPDTFGHSTHLPELDTHGQIKYYYMCRGAESDDILFRWRAPSGKELLVYREQYWYNNGIVPLAGVGLIDISEKCAGLKTGLIVYGVGNHGGGPSRRDVERAIEMDGWPVFPKFTFSTLRTFFQRAESVRALVPLKEGEQNFVAPGCYTTQSRIKLGNRKTEASLHDSQLFAALASQKISFPYAQAEFERAWQKVLFTHFHDIITGSNVQESREYAMALYAQALAITQTQYTNAARTLSEQIDTSMIVMDQDIADNQAEGAGTGYGLTSYGGIPNPERGCGKTRIYHVFNPSSHTRTEPVEITLWDWTGDKRYMRLENTKHEPLRFQIVDATPNFYWDHLYTRILVEVSVPAMGYSTIVLSEAEPEEYAIYYQKDAYRDAHAHNFVLENQFLRAEFDYENGELISLIDKETGREKLREGKTAGLRYIDTERRTSSAWSIGKHTDTVERGKLISITRAFEGPLRQGFKSETHIRNSVVKASVYLDAGARALTYAWSIDWHEVARGESQIPVLIYELPLRDKVARYMYDVPGGVTYRGEIWLDVPGLQFGAALDEQKRAVALLTDCKYGYRGMKNNLSVTLINASAGPDPYPERGIHAITLRVAVTDDSPISMLSLAQEAHHPIMCQTAGSHPGCLPAEASLLTFDAPTAVLSSVTRDGEALVLRMYEVEGKDCVAELRFDSPVAACASVLLLGDEAESTPVVSGETVRVAMKPYTMHTLKVTR